MQNPIIPQSLDLTQAHTQSSVPPGPARRVPGIRLGQALNLLLGFKPGWVARSAETSPFFSPATEPLPTFDAMLDAVESTDWGLPRVTLHSDTRSLLSAVFPYEVQQLSGDSSAFSVPSGPLMIDDLDATDTLAALESQLGVSLSSGYAFMLVEIIRAAGTVQRSYVAGGGGSADQHLTPAALASVQALPGVLSTDKAPGTLGAQDSAAFVNSFASLGTHYVSEVVAGDRIFQVFAYEAAPFQQLQAAFTRAAGGNDYVEGIPAVAFQYYTTPRSSQTGVTLGYVSQLGQLNIVSQDPAFTVTVSTGEWSDPQRAGGNSIFAAYQPQPTVDLSGLQTIVPIGLTLTPIGNLIPVDKCGAGRTRWDRLLKGTLLQKYGQAVRVTFPARDDYQWQNLLPNAGAWLSTIATPSVDVYDAHVALGAIQLTNRAAVKTFSSWSIVLESGADDTAIPGDKVSFSSYLIDTAGPDAPPSIEFASKTAFDGASFACGKMDGAILLQYAGGSAQKVLVDGVRLEATGPVANTGRAGVQVSGDLFGTQDVVRLTGQTSNLNFAIVSCQTLLYSRGSTASQAQSLARDCLLWLTQLIPNEDTTPQELAAIRLRAAYLAHIARRLDEEGVTVPYLTYNNYQNYIAAMSTAANTLTGTIHDYQTQIEFQKTRELTAKTAQEINDNVKTSGNLLRQYIDAVAVNQGDIAQNYASIIATKQRELDSALKSFKDLAQSVADQKDAVESAKLAFQRAMADYETTEIIKAVITISTAFVTVGIAIATPSSTISALKDLGETAQKIQKLLTVLDKIMALEKTIEGTVKNIVAVNRTLDALQSTKLEMPTSLQWSEMGINFDASLASAPSEVAAAKANFSAAFKILVLRAQAMLTAQSKISQLNGEIALNQAQKKINDDQQQRLNKITAALHFGDTSKAPNMSEIDLLSLTGQVQSQLNQVLSSLAQAMILQDSAVQFELLAAPTEIRRFDLSSLQLVMASQQANIIAAKQAFNPPPFKVNDPIKVTVKGVPISQFTGGNTYEFILQPSISELQPYNMVRVQQVVVDIPAIKGSKGGRYRIDLAFQGDPFEDRNPNGEPLLFNTVTRNFGPFEYKVEGHTPVFGDQTGSIGDNITRVTPFSTWQIRMPDLPVNAELDFGGNPTVDIVLSFRIEALAQPALHALCEQQGKPASTLRHGELMQRFTMLYARPQARSGLLAATDTPEPATLENMLSQMYKAQGVLKGWDCVLNLLEDPVNQFLAAQYKEKYSAAKPMTVAVGFCQAFPAGPTATLIAYTKFSVDLGPPLLQFQGNNHNFVSVTQAIQSGYMVAGSRLVNQKDAKCPVPPDLDNPNIEWATPTQVDVSQKPTVTGAVGLGMVQGIVTPPLPDGTPGNPQDAHSVVLDFTQGSFVAKDLNIDTDMAQLNLQLSNWFVNNPIQYVINTVVFNDASTLTALQPTRFKLNVLTTNSQKNILQVFITTNGTQRDNLTINVNEPIPDGYHNSLMINTKIMFNDIFVKSFNQGSSNLQVATVNPGDDFTAWSAKVTSGTVSGEAKFNNTSNSETRINASSNVITWPLTGLTFSRTQDLGLQLNYNVTQTVNFQHRTYNCSSGPYGTYCSWSSWSDYSVDVTVGLTGNYPITVVDTDGKQDVQIDSAPPNVTLTPPDLKPTGPCECNDNDLKIQVGQILKAQVPAKLQDSMAGIKFTPVSVFALYNLLFPTGDFIEMKSAYVPADLVVLGTFNKYVTQS